MTQLPNVLRYGRPEPRLSELRIKAGELEADFEPATAFVRRITWRGQLALLGIYPAVRDRNWGTVAPQVQDIELSSSDDACRLSCSALCEEDGIRFHWDLCIAAYAHGLLRFTCRGRALSGFWRNRIGLCVLHPAQECAGRWCLVETTDGEARDGSFPEHIAPHQPFLDLRAISHRLADGALCRVQFEGDVFEMEDQRNWTDVSFKTYCTPLSLPFPVHVPAGAEVNQRAEVRITADPGRLWKGVCRARTVPARVEITGAAVPLPLIGHDVGEELPGPREVEVLRSHLRPDFVRLQVCPEAPDLPARIQRASGLARDLGCGLEAVLLLRDGRPRSLSPVAQALGQAQAPVVRWLVLAADADCTRTDDLSRARSALGALCPDAVWGVGTRGHFAQLTRCRPDASAADFVCFPVTPQVHASDDETILENAPGAGWAVAEARRLYPLAAVAVAPVTLKPQYNPVATGPLREASADDLPPSADPRQVSLLGAAWLLGTLAGCAAAGASAIGAGELCGLRGLMELHSPSPRPACFRSQRGQLYPMAWVLADLRAFPGARVLPAQVVGGPRATCLALETNTNRAVCVCNADDAALALSAPFGGRRRIRVITCQNAEAFLADAAALRSPDAFVTQAGPTVSLPPWSYALIITPEG